MIPKEAIDRIKNYPYKSNDYSLLSKYYYPLCNFILEFIPEYISPNVITLCGLLAVMLSTFSLLLSISSFSFIICALSLLIYQITDALDGLQGKKTGMYYNPTIELFDHGCDSIVTSLCAINFVLIFNNISPLALITSLISVTSLFYFPTWEHLHTKVMTFRGSFCNPTESLFALELSYLVLAFSPALAKENIMLNMIIFMQVIHAIYVIHQSTNNVVNSPFSSAKQKIKSLIPMMLFIFLLFLYSKTSDFVELVGGMIIWSYAVLELIWSEITGLEYDFRSFFIIFVKQLLFPHEFVTNIIYYLYRFNNYTRIMCDVLNMKNFWNIPI